MGKYKKISLWLMGTAGALLVLLFAFLLLLPKLINLEPIKAKVRASLSEKVGGEVEYQRFDLSFLPRPHVVIHQVSLSIRGRVAGTLETMTVYPEILPLLRRRVRISMLRVEAPEFRMELPERPEEKEDRPKPFSLATIEENAGPVLALMALKAPGLTFVADGGRLDVFQGNVSLLTFQDIHGRISLPPDRLGVELMCNSNLWERISVEGWLAPEDFKANGRILVKHFKPHVLTDQLLPSGPQKIGDSHLNLDVSFKMDGLEVLQAEVQGSLPLLTLQRAHEKLVIRGKSLKGAFSMDADGITVSLTDLDLDHPQLSISGTLVMDQTPPRVRLELEGREVDVYSMREAALALGESLPINREILGMAREGKISFIMLNAEGSSLADLGKAENIFIRGKIVEGKMFLPGGNIGLEGVDLDVEGMKGEVTISQGMLEGKNLGARWKNAHIREGTLTLGLKGEDPPFYVEAAVEVDMAQLPLLLAAFIKREAFAREMARTYDIKGNAVGRLVLGVSAESSTMRVDVSEFNLFARHPLLPYPLKIERGQVYYDGNTIGVRNLTGKVGKSSFSGLSARLRLEETTYLEILSGTSFVFLAEIYPWLSSLEGLNGLLKDLKSVHGTIAISTVYSKGPLTEPEKWRFRIKGDVANLALDSAFFPGPLTVSKAGFEATTEQILLEDCETIILDASLNGSGIFKNYLAGVQKVDFTLQGNVGPQATRWVWDVIDMPSKLRIGGPLSIAQAHAVWNSSGRASFAANLAVKDGPKVSVEMLLNPEELRLKNLHIQDRQSNASFALTLRERELHLDFDGHLDKATLNKLLGKNEILTGLVDGDFEAHILLDNPMASTAQGKLMGEGLLLPVNLKVPVNIDSVSLEAKRNNLKVESALFTLGDNRMALEGNVEVSPDGPLLDMNLSAHEVEWKSIGKILGEDGKKRDLKQAKSSWNLLVQGIVRFKTQRFTYDRFTLSPLHADVSFSRNEVSVAVSEANLCGISLPGLLKVSPQELLLDFKPVSKNKELDPSLTCLANKSGLMTGSFNLNGELKARGKFEEMAKVLKGSLEFTASDGRIYRFGLLAKIFALLNITEIFRGELPDLTKEGFAYNSIRAKSDLEDGKLLLREVLIDGSSMEIACEGDIDLIDKKLDLTVLVAPLKTVDRIVKKIPLIRNITAGTLVSIPVKARGDLANPKVTPLAPLAVGSELLGIMKRTLKLPIKVIQPFLPEDKEKEDAP